MANLRHSDIMATAKLLGIREAKVIPAASVRTAAWVSMKCRYGCEHYGQSLCCPPHSPTYKEMREVLKDYGHAAIIQCHTLEETTERALELERALFKMGYHKALGFGGGKCLLCSSCNLNACTKPMDARPSMEACGIDVIATVRASGMPIGAIEGSEDAAETIYYGYGLVLID